VYSRNLQAVTSARTRIWRTFEPDAVQQLKESSAADLSIGGANLAGQALNTGLVDELHLLVTPIII
jgi:riboflavin biosynthesis pyrimidine reductase